MKALQNLIVLKISMLSPHYQIVLQY